MSKEQDDRDGTMLNRHNYVALRCLVELIKLNGGVPKERKDVVPLVQRAFDFSDSFFRESYNRAKRFKEEMCAQSHKGAAPKENPVPASSESLG